MQLDLSQLITIGLLCIVFGMGTSIFIKRVDWLYKFGRGTRKWTNGIVNFIAPPLAIYLAPFWSSELGDIHEGSRFIVMILVALITYGASQITHAKDSYQPPGVAPAEKPAAAPPPPAPKKKTTRTTTKKAA